MDRGYSDIIVDFKDLHEEIDKNLPDHKFLNEIYPFNPTAENLAKYFFDFYSVLVMEKKWPVRLSRVEVWESPSSCAAYEAE
jgi:6-pyruvoyltetrahydropterin/6-carboxytetrahydropterin synthase